MKTILRFALILCLICQVTISIGFAQYANTKVRTKNQQYTDSLKQVEYNHTFPIWGQGAYKKGFDIPYPAGGMINYIWMKQSLILENMQLGFTNSDVDIPMTNVDFIEFGQNTNISQSYNVRPDLWILPFLNVYGILGYGMSHTEVNIVAPFELSSVVDQNIRTGGIGFLLAGGIGPVWVTTDFNWTWNKPDLLEESVLVNVIGIRVGHSFVFKHKPQSNLALWAGAQGIDMGAQTVGSIALKDALPQEVWDKKDQFVSDYYAWNEQQTPVKQEFANQIFTPIVENIDSKNGEGIVKYSMNKKTKERWNGVIGIQYQLSKRWQFRFESGVIGDRKSVLGSVNYRFLL